MAPFSDAHVLVGRISGLASTTGIVQPAVDDGLFGFRPCSMVDVLGGFVFPHALERLDAHERHLEIELVGMDCCDAAVSPYPSQRKFSACQCEFRGDVLGLGPTVWDLRRSGGTQDTDDIRDRRARSLGTPCRRGLNRVCVKTAPAHQLETPSDLLIAPLSVAVPIHSRYRLLTDSARCAGRALPSVL
jgi:hypothetical protein